MSGVQTNVAVGQKPTDIIKTGLLQFCRCCGCFWLLLEKPRISVYLLVDIEARYDAPAIVSAMPIIAIAYISSRRNIRAAVVLEFSEICGLCLRSQGRAGPPSTLSSSKGSTYKGKRDEKFEVQQLRNKGEEWEADLGGDAEHVHMKEVTTKRHYSACQTSCG